MRKAKPKKRIILPDPKFNDILVTKFVNNMMLQGKKTTAYRIFYEAMEVVAQKTSEDPVEVWKKALANVTPAVEVRSRRIGGATFQIPAEIRPGRKVSIGMKNLIGFSRKRHEKSMGQKLAGEILAAYKDEGAAYKKKEDTHRMAEANKAFSHFRF
jgi:small subunit ribosomal protein S7